MTTSTPPTPPTPPTASPDGLPQIDLSSTDLGCVRCGYNLRGLSPEGMCPECGAAIAQSLRGDLLEFSSPEYLASLHRGVVVVLTAIIAYLLLMIISIGVGFASAANAAAGGAAGGAAAPAGTHPIQGLLQVLSLATTVALVVGWWLFSAPDPAMLGNDKGDRPRQVVRGALIAMIAATALSTVFSFAPASIVGVGLFSLAVLIGLLSLGAYVVGYFAQMLYVRWLARRIPNRRVEKRAKLLMWLGPVLFILGAPFLMLGPLIAIILYWNMLEWVRKDLKSIRARQLV